VTAPPRQAGAETGNKFPWGRDSYRGAKPPAVM